MIKAFHLLFYEIPEHLFCQVSDSLDSHKRIETGFFESFSTYTTGGHKPYEPFLDGYDEFISLIRNHMIKE